MNDVASIRDEESASHFSSTKKDRFKTTDIEHLLKSTEKIINSPDYSKSSKRGSPVISLTAKAKQNSNRKA